MSTYEDNLLAARFAALAPEPLAGDWDDVLGRTGVARNGRRRRLVRSPALQSRRRRLFVAFAVAALVVAVGTAAAFGIRALFFDRGFIGLPPQGATPSTPKSGKLVIFYWVNAPGNPRRITAWVYADGRIISLREGDPHQPRLPEAANRWSSGFLEQRLTRAGVELMRSEILAAAADPPPPLTPRVYTNIWVREGARFVRVRWDSDLKRLEARLADPVSWLRASAWKQREFKAYVPSRFAACFRVPASKPAPLLTLLPPAARDLLRGKRWARFQPHPRGFQRGSGPDYCADVTTDEARLLAKALDGAGLEQVWETHLLSYRLKARRPGSFVDFYFEPYLPHGQFTCSPCG
jgi:hypothetical protein